MHTLEPGVFLRHDPVVTPAPVIVDVSRSGREYPAEMRSMVPFTVLHDNVSMYVDELWGDAPKIGGTLLYAMFPSFWIDANRADDDIDADLIEGEWPVPLNPTVSQRGLGLLKSKSRYGEPVHERKLTVDEVMHRLNAYYHPYHRELKRLLDDAKKEFGTVYQLSCHCMSAVGAPTHPDAGQPRADFCVGNLGGKSSSEDFLHFVADQFRSLGYTCSVNEPYQGGELNRRYGDAAGGVESIMIEINKKLFMDVNTFKKKPAGFAQVKEACNHVLKAVADRAIANVRPKAKVL